MLTTGFGPVVPGVVTVSGPDEKFLAGPYWALPVAAVALMGTAESLAGSVTVGTGTQPGKST